MLTTLSDSILQDIVTKYRSLQEPDFRFQDDAMASRPFALLVDELLVHFFLKERTDPNQDASFVYAIRFDQQEWILQLSMVGRYGVLFRTSEAGLSLVEPNEMSTSPEELLILHLARKYRVTLLGRNVLTKPVPLRLFSTEPKNVRFYHALFSEDRVRWQGVWSKREEEAGMVAA
jgi:hypothetical protein